MGEERSSSSYLTNPETSAQMIGYLQNQLTIVQLFMASRGLMGEFAEFASEVSTGALGRE